ncbi:uncharacterized protein LOC100205321 [Hydra vulgaris]|uniref:uncharacterized protein LOC100205321 n=1 Tax=Hydra vulgaris TaxID=6087 RepID=UPI001F5FAC86|nr:uncharacterized protein LOC100205321 isoform X2 [Hydra vulgaris]XP_047130678.1 uncharacterized protein LOC100205321 isoform X2 [Hydra vulgaris]XP_047130679.1 uncharacterized protein LOC100205321 isoform X2 [Hydra vulgaris]XP_047130680.1 uncharacterized protein LOC100205321 isoform X2 [Hydra vulgaris]XP_047130681.1 uncharacterized protein LOC100205321 isoform X2 [Hydra vulgaris]
MCKEFYKTKDELFESWSKDGIVLNKDDFLNHYQDLLHKINVIDQNTFLQDADNDQRKVQSEIFESFSKSNSLKNSLTKDEFFEFYKEKLKDLLKIHYVIGIDVGGTNTDLVILKMPEVKIMSKCKVPTTADIKSGLKNGIITALKKDVQEKTQKEFGKFKEIQIEMISSILIGTTAFVNSVIQRSENLKKVQVIRISGPSTTSLYPFIDFPNDLRERIEGDFQFTKEECKNLKLTEPSNKNDKCIYLSGGFNHNGSFESTKFDVDQVKKVMFELVKHYRNNKISVLNIAVTGVFASVNKEQELKVQRIASKIFNKEKIRFTISLSHKLGGLGLIERENATIINASLREYAFKTVKSFTKAFKELGFKNKFYFTTNDGTLASSDYIEKFPVFTFSSGPINSLRGAGFLVREKNYIVADIGGTTCDVGEIKNYCPTESKAFISIGGIRLNAKMINVKSIGLGGGSKIKFDNRFCKIGPESVGYKLTTEDGGQAFGGMYLTTTDVALKLGYCITNCNFNYMKVDSIRASEEECIQAKNEILVLIKKCVESVKTNSANVPLVLVGGGSCIVPIKELKKKLKDVGISEVYLPHDFDVANAIGAAITKISEKNSTIVDGGSIKIKSHIKKKLIFDAIEKAVKRGAIKEFTTVTELTESPMAYTNDGSLELFVKVVGSLNLRLLKNNRENQKKINNLEENSMQSENRCFEESFDSYLTDEDIVENTNNASVINIEAEHIENTVDFLKNTEMIAVPDLKRNEWNLSLQDIKFIALGGSILGSGGGGSPYMFFLICKDLLEQGKKIRVISPSDMEEEDLAVPVAFFGAPNCIFEKLCNLKEIVNSFEAIKGYYNNDKNIKYVVSAEVGGLNSLVPLALAAIYGIPVVDADLMGRAFPKVSMTILAINNQQVLPISLADDHDNVFVVPKIHENDQEVLETHFRNICGLISNTASIALSPISKDQVQNFGVKYSLSKCWRIGRSILSARKNREDFMKVLENEENASLLIKGKIIECRRVIENAYNIGFVIIQGDSFDENDKTFYNKFYRICIQNENLLAQEVDKVINNETKIVQFVPKFGENLCCTPNLISIVDVDTFDAILCEDLKFGIKVLVFSMPSPTGYDNEKALKVVGPQGFKYQGKNEDLKNWSLNQEYKRMKGGYVVRESLITKYETNF